MKKFIISIFAMFLLSGCVTLNTQYQGDDSGFAIMSFYIKNHNFAGDYVVIYENDKGESGRFYYRKDAAWGRSERDFDDASYNGRVELHQLKAGKYLITKYEQIQGARTFHYADFEPYSFEVKKNEATYLGELTEPVGGSGMLQVKDKFERDVSIAKQKGLPENIKTEKQLMNESMLKVKGSRYFKVQ
ncbi:membrane lipoprotein lipid attachment site-containing protein [Pseudoalteromonas sp. McH1-7]|uniref:membrane lipoprotein lipid attachment site-containing protein n=1 Tax=Pseudoalteromonas sp. McH1-7 TaxID=2745574 RepID=UPI001592470C|nr:membrane lipoprotein lipid attachment site-containing protein [Pseudoalteromonas sp. McH1-7]NUZ09661.1 membrane lipoprotein lipid attachment site-containing protein [Pseudoalteromonas sp. McH1-7]